MRMSQLVELILEINASHNAQEKLIRLVNRAELAVKYPLSEKPSMHLRMHQPDIDSSSLSVVNFEQLEEEVYAKIAGACDQQVHYQTSFVQ